MTWRLRAAPVDDLVLLDRTDGPSWIEDGSSAMALELLRREVFRTVESRSTVVRELAALLARARVHRLHAGPDGLAADVLVEKLGRAGAGD
jgi:hypothetical protein